MIPNYDAIRSAFRLLGNVDNSVIIKYLKKRLGITIKYGADISRIRVELIDREMLSSNSIISSDIDSYLEG